MIYKPSHCSPSLSTITLGADTTFFECVLDSSNVGVEGYSLTVWGPDGEVIFPKAFTTTSAGATMPYITTVDDLKVEFPEVVADAVNTGLNGSLLRFPFVYDKNPVNFPVNPSGEPSYSWAGGETVKYNCLLPCFFVETSGPTVSISDQQTYLAQSPYFMANHFVYNGTNWTLNGNQVTLNDWGLSVSGTFSAGANFTIRFTAQDFQGNPIFIYSGETYKWTITLYHLDNGNIPADLDWYDTQIASGTVIGSNDGRIQAIYSDNIYSDYYIQPIYIPGLDVTNGYENWTAPGGTTAVQQALATTANLGFRAKIDEYDYSYGFIYPTKDEFSLPEGVIQYKPIDPTKANAFQIYKYTNSYAATESGNKVAQAPHVSVPMTWVSKGEDGYGQYSWNLSTSGYRPYTSAQLQEWYDQYQRGNLVPFMKALSAWNPTYAEAITQFDPLSNGDLILLNFQQGIGGWTPVDSTTIPPEQWYDATANPACKYNGIYSITVECTPTKNITTSEIDELDFVATLKRADSANTYNALLNNAYCVASSMLNSAYLKYAKQVVTLAQANTAIGPVLNEIAVQLSAEKPVKLYNYSDNGSGTDYVSAELRNQIGIINYNYLPTGTTIPGRLFIRPSRGVEAGMRLVPKFYVNGEANSNYLTIDKTGCLNNIDAISYIEYSDPGALTTIVIPGTTTNVLDDPADVLQYEIKTFFAEGDENYFTVECPPTLSFAVADSLTTYEPDQNTGVYSVDSRSLTVTANYDQQQFVSWRSFQYHLISSNDNWEKLKILKSYPERYDGTITVDIEGLTGTEYGQDKNYILLLQGETVSGLQFQRELKIHTDFDESDTTEDPGKFTTVFDPQYNCVAITVSELTPETQFSIYRREIWYSESSNAPGFELLFTPVTIGKEVPSGVSGSTYNCTFNDYNVKNGCLYDYVLVVPGHSYRASSRVEWRGWSVSELAPQTSEVEGFEDYFVDSDNVWKFKYNVSPGDFTQQMQRNVQDTMGRYAQVFVGPKRSVSGQVSCLIGEIAHVSGQTIYSNYTRKTHAYKNSTWLSAQGQLRNVGGYQEYAKSRLTSNEEVDLLTQWKNVCFSGEPKLLRDEKGQSFLIAITGASFSVDHSMGNLPISISFEWEQVGDSSNAMLISPPTWEEIAGN